MIAKGTTHNNGAKLARYMVTGKKSERAELFQLRGFAERDIVDAFRSIHILADATHCDKPFFHAQVRNPEGEEITREQWEQVADRIEAKLGYSGQPRAIAFHTDEKSGHEHMHVAWSRIDDENMIAKPLPFFKLRLKEVCRELEEELDITRVSSARPGPEMAPTRDEDTQARRLGVDLHGIRATIREALEHSDTGQAFAAALEEHDLTLCQGDRRDYIVLDQEGGLHALGKRLLGISARELRAFMGDIDRDQLPTVEEARQQLAAEHIREYTDEKLKEWEANASSVERATPDVIHLYDERPPSAPRFEREPTGQENTGHDTPPFVPRDRVDIDIVARGAERFAGAVFDLGEKVTEPAIEGMANAFESLFDPVQKPVPGQTKQASREDKPEDGPVDHWRYLVDEDYRKQIMQRDADERERQIKIREELDRAGHSRDRER